MPAIVLVFAAGNLDYVDKLNSLVSQANVQFVAVDASAAAAQAAAALAVAAQTAVEGAGNNPAIRTNLQSITTDKVIPAGENGLSVGPVTINAGVTVTVPTDTYWSVI